METADSNARHRVMALADLLGRRLPHGADEKLQGLAADLLVVIDDVWFLPDATVQLARARLAVAELLSPMPNLILVERITQELRRKCGGRGLRLFRRALKVTPPQVAVVLGLVAALLIFGPGGYIGAVLAQRLLGGQALIPGTEIAHLMWIGFVGAHGSLLSILVRLRDFQRPQLPLTAFFTGLFKPFIGMSFAHLSYALLKSGALPLNIPTNIWSFIAIGFLAGFSERLAKDLVSLGEQVGTRTSSR